MRRKTKQELIDELVNGFEYDPKELSKMPKDDLQELYDELHGRDILFPNSRDYDAEDEDGI